MIDSFAESFERDFVQEVAASMSEPATNSAPALHSLWINASQDLENELINVITRLSGELKDVNALKVRAKQ